MHLRVVEAEQPAPDAQRVDEEELAAAVAAAAVEVDREQVERLRG